MAITHNYYVIDPYDKESFTLFNLKFYEWLSSFRNAARNSVNWDHFTKLIPDKEFCAILHDIADCSGDIEKLRELRCWAARSEFFLFEDDHIFGYVAHWSDNELSNFLGDELSIELDELCPFVGLTEDREFTYRIYPYSSLGLLRDLCERNGIHLLTSAM